MKTTTCKLAGNTYPLALTVSSAAKIIDKYEDIKTAVEILQSSDIKKVMVDSIPIIWILLDGGKRYAALNGEDAKEPPKLENLSSLLFPYELPKIRVAAIKAILQGLKRDIEAEADSKNAETTRGD